MRIYPTGSASGKCYGTAKKHKIPVNGTINHLPSRSVISNIGTASYQLAKYLAKLLSPLSTSEYTVANNMEFINHIKRMNLPKNHSFISSNVKSLFTWNRCQHQKIRNEGTVTFMHKECTFYIQ